MNDNDVTTHGAYGRPEITDIGDFRELTAQKSGSEPDFTKGQGTITFPSSTTK